MYGCVGVAVGQGCCQCVVVVVGQSVYGCVGVAVGRGCCQCVVVVVGQSVYGCVGVAVVLSVCGGGGGSVTVCVWGLSGDGEVG